MHRVQWRARVATRSALRAVPVIRRDLSPAEVRVLGCLIEKQRTTPDQYPLTRNALRLACNQSTNRDPVVDFDEETLRAAVERLGRYGLVRFTSTRGSRAAKYRHLAGEKLGIGEAELTLLALLMLRGPQTPGELRGRSERLHRFGETRALEDALAGLIEAGLAVRFERRPGQKEQRCAHLLSADAEGAEELQQEHAGEAARLATEPAPAAMREAAGEPPARPPTSQPGPTSPAPTPPGLEARVAALEAELHALREQLSDLLED